jgi:uncharacterized RDD family membrane protein YckC
MPYCAKCGNELLLDTRFCPKCGTPVLSYRAAESASPSTADSGLKLALWGERFVAWLIDIVILGVIIGLLGLVAWFAAWQPHPALPSWFPLFNFGTGGLVYFLYWTIMEGAYGQSIGKMAMRLRVAKLDGGAIGFSEAAVESVGKAFFLIIDVFLGWALYPRLRQRIFHYLSKTVVVRE